MIPATTKFNITKLLLSKSILDDNVIHCILTYYWKLLDNKRKVLLPWININNLYWDQLSRNPNAIDILRKKIETEKTLTAKEYYKLDLCNLVDWEYLSANTNAIDLLLENKNKIIWYWLSKNPNAIELLKENQDKINWNILSLNYPLS